MIPASSAAAARNREPVVLYEINAAVTLAMAHSSSVGSDDFDHRPLAIDALHELRRHGYTVEIVSETNWRIHW